MSRAENAYIGRENVTRRFLRVAGRELEPEEKQAITKVQFRLGPHCLDTSVPGDPITYDATEGFVDIKIGLIPELQEGTLTGKLIVFDAALTKGKAWGSFEVVVMPWPACDE